MVMGNVSLGLGIRRLFYLVSTNETTFERVEDVPDYLNEAIPFFVGAILLEYVIALVQGAQTFRFNDGLSSVSAGFLLQLSKFLLISLELVVHTWIYANWRFIDLSWDSPLTWWTAFIGIDFFYYWFHRAAHEINIIWAAHQAHHSSEDYNLTTALRQSVIQHLNSVAHFKHLEYYKNKCYQDHIQFFYVPLGLFLPPSVFFVHVQFNILYQFWIHTELIKSLGPLEYIFNSPSHHRVHHGRNPYCIDKNYGGTLIIWDRLFGTFQEETDEKVVYGLVHPLNTWNPIWIQFCHYVHIAKAFWSVEGIKNKISVFVKGPGWTPGAPRLGDPAEIPAIEFPIQKYDASLPLWGNIYIAVHSVIFVISFQELFLRHLILSEANVLGAVLFMMFTITSFGLLMDNKWYAPFLELLRCVGFLVVDYVLSSRQTHVGVLPLPILGTVRVIYVVSAFIWLQLCSHSEKTVEKKE